MFLTEEECKQPLVWEGENYKFITVRDLSEPIRICKVDYYPTRSELAADVAVFIGMWMLNTHPLLNGFSGLDTITWVR